MKKYAYLFKRYALSFFLFLFFANSYAREFKTEEHTTYPHGKVIRPEFKKEYIARPRGVIENLEPGYTNYSYYQDGQTYTGELPTIYECRKVNYKGKRIIYVPKDALLPDEAKRLVPKGDEITVITPPIYWEDPIFEPSTGQTFYGIYRLPKYTALPQTAISVGIAIIGFLASNTVFNILLNTQTKKIARVALRIFTKKEVDTPEHIKWQNTITSIIKLGLNSAAAIGLYKWSQKYQDNLIN